jgi:hypothetical protein
MEFKLEYEWALLGATIFGVFFGLRRALPSRIREHSAVKIFLRLAPLVAASVAGVVLWGTPERGMFRAGLYGVSAGLMSRGLWEGLKAAVRSLPNLIPGAVARALGLAAPREPRV